MDALQIITTSVNETLLLGSLIGAELQAGALLPLIGDLGSGKTSFTQGLLSGLQLGQEQFVTSPSFTLMNCYNARLPVYHFDLYRLNTIEEVYDIGLFDYLDGKGVVIIEWAEKILAELPGNQLKITITFDAAQQDEIRILTIEDVEDQYTGILEKLRNVYPWYRNIM